MSDEDGFEDGFEDGESRSEHWVFIGSLMAMGLIAVTAGVLGSWKWIRSWLFVLVLCLLPSVASAQGLTATKIAWAGYITAAFAADSVTSYGIGKGTVHEANPILRPIVEQRGPVVAMTVKGAMHAGISLLILKYHKDAPKRTFWITVGLTAAQVAVDALNVRTVGR